jgi:hypothetical protein
MLAETDVRQDGCSRRVPLLPGRVFGKYFSCFFSAMRRYPRADRL